MFGYLLTACLAITLLSYSKGSDISDQRLCFDPKCSVPLSRAKTLIKYVTSYDEGLSFQPGVEVVIYSKSAGSKPELWGAEVGGRRGYVPKGMVRELEVFHAEKTLKYTVPTDLSDETEKKEPDVEIQEGSTEAMQEKTDDLKINENPVNINSESSVKNTFDVIDGTTFYADTLGLATPTIHPLDSSSTEMGAVAIESTSSFAATSSGMSTAGMTTSEMAPISPTTMMEKLEEHETSQEDVGKSSDEEGGRIKSVFNLMSEMVSGGELEHDKNSTLVANGEKGEGNAYSPDDGKRVEVAEATGENKIEADGKVDDLLPNDSEEMTDDEDDDDVEDEEEEGDEEEDGDEDDEEDIEAEGNDENIENNTRDIAENHSDGRSMGEELSEVKEETKSEMISSINKSDLDVVGSSAPVGAVSSPEDPKPILGVDEGGTSLKKNVGNLDSVDEVTSETYVSTQTESYFNETSPSQDLEFNAEPSNDTGLNKLQEINTVTLNADSSDRVETLTDNTSYNIDKPADSLTVEIESPNGVRDSEHSVLKEDADHDHNNDSNLKSISGDIFVDGAMMKSQEALVEEPQVTTEATGKEKPETLTMNDQDLKLDSSAIALEVTSETFLTAAPTADLADHYSESSVQTEPANVISNEYHSYPDHPDVKPLEEMKTVEEVESKLQSQQIVEGGKNMGLDTSTDLKESENQEDDVVIESPNASDTENLLPVPEDSSSGIFSTLFGSLGSGYGFVSSMIFGSGDERIEVIEGQEGSSQGVSHITAGKYSDSEHNLYQHSPSEDVQKMAAGGDSVFGSHLNSHCDGSPETMCEELSTKLPSNTISSSDAIDQISEEDQESSSWVGLPNFSIGNDSNGIFNFNVPSYGAVIYSIITGVIVLCFFLGHYFIEGKRRDVVLLAKINALEKELTVSSKECLILKEKLNQFEMKSSDFDDSAEVINSIKSELEKIQNEKTQLEKELEATTEAGLEMEHMVSQFLSSQHDSKSLMESIEQLQMQANKQQAKISSLENSLVAKTQENEKLAQELGVTESKVQELEEDLKQVSENLHQRDEDHSKEYAELKELSESKHNKYLEDLKNKTIETEMALTRCKSLETTLTEMKEMLAVKENEICVLQECLQQLKLSNGDDPDKAESQLKDILNFGKLKADLTAVTKERDNLKEKLQGEEDARRLLEDHVKVIREEVEKLRKCHEAAEREKVEAQTRLEVLSSYFKEKESQLQKELGNKEALWIQKHTDASTIMQRMKSLEEEVENYKKEGNVSKPNVSECVSWKEAKEITTTHPVKECKEENISKSDVFVGSTSEKIAKETVGEPSEKKGSQNETLKKEILDQERGYKTQLATFEKKAHENWVAARQAERKLEESKQEASQLRNRLTMADKTNPTSTSQNGDDSKPNLRVPPVCSPLMENPGRKKFSKIRRFWSTLECAPSESHTQTK